MLSMATSSWARAWLSCTSCSTNTVRSMHSHAGGDMLVVDANKMLTVLTLQLDICTTGLQLDSIRPLPHLQLLRQAMASWSQQRATLCTGLSSMR